MSPSSSRPFVWCLLHASCENPGLIALELERKGVGIRYVRTWAGEPVPDLGGGAAGLVVMGGPMGVYETDKYPFLADEMNLIRQMEKENLPVLGICLGAQLIAAAFGGNVAPGPAKEIGWYPVKITGDASDDPLWSRVPERNFVAFHWHGDRLELPDGAVHLASSEMTPNQAFRYGRNVWGIQFHLEVDSDLIAGMTRAFDDELQAERIPRERLLDGRASYLPRLESISHILFGGWAGLVKSGGLSLRP